MGYIPKETADSGRDNASSLEQARRTVGSSSRNRSSSRSYQLQLKAEQEAQAAAKAKAAADAKAKAKAAAEAKVKAEAKRKQQEQLRLEQQEAKLDAKRTARRDEDKAQARAEREAIPPGGDMASYGLNSVAGGRGVLAQMRANTDEQESKYANLAVNFPSLSESLQDEGVTSIDDSTINQAVQSYHSANMNNQAAAAVDAITSPVSLGIQSVSKLVTGRGIAQLGQDFYDDLVADNQTPIERAGTTAANADYQKGGVINSLRGAASTVAGLAGKAGTAATLSNPVLSGIAGMADVALNNQYTPEQIALLEAAGIDYTANQEAARQYLNNRRNTAKTTAVPTNVEPSIPTEVPTAETTASIDDVPLPEWIDQDIGFDAMNLNNATRQNRFGR